MSYDYLIIGSGAGGCAAAYRLALAGKRVLLVEKGRDLPADGSTLDVRRVIADGEFKSKECWLDGQGRSFRPEEYFNLGGKTRWYGAALLRLARDEFQADPAFQCLGWPFGYQGLEPYYREAENLLGIRTFECEEDLSAIKARLDGTGWRAWPLPLALDERILADAQESRHFDGFASAAGLKGEGLTAFLSPVRTLPNLRILTGKPVRQLLPGDPAANRVAGVRLDDGQTVFGDRLLLAAGALHSPRLLQALLQSTRVRIPGGRLVGAYYKRHLLTAQLAISRQKKSDVLRKTTIWYHADFPHGSIQPLGFGSDVLASLLPRFLPARLAKAIGERAYGFFLQTEDGSHEANCVRAAHNGRALPRLDYDPKRTPGSGAEHRRMVRHFAGALRRAGCWTISRAIPLTGTAHACGTLVTGCDPAQSVVDAWGRVHGLQNLYVVDGSVLPRVSRVNPSLTIYAWALRVADHLIREEAPQA